MSDDEKTYTVEERVYETLEDGRTVLAAAPGDVISEERAKELGLIGKKRASTSKK